MTVVSKTAFVGDSLTEGGRWQEWFPEFEAINLGVGGDTTEGLIERLDEVAAADPDTVVLLIGTNDVANRRAVEQVVRNIETILVNLRAALPDARILLQSVMPRGREYAEFVRRSTATPGSSPPRSARTTSTCGRSWPRPTAS